MFGMQVADVGGWRRWLKQQVWQVLSWWQQA